jgi:predicted GIY-YIG superfamily endonuclease
MKSESKKAGNKTSGRWLLYILKCCDSTLYTGITNDLERRLDQHNSGKASRYTRARVPVVLVYKEGCRSKSSALKKELRIKALSREEKDEYIVGTPHRKRRRIEKGRN